VLNNLDFWKDRDPSEFGLAYEAYDNSPGFGLFHKSRYVSDSEWSKWKSYERGHIMQGDSRSFSEHIDERPDLVYLLVHPETWFDRHPYES